MYLYLKVLHVGIMHFCKQLSILGPSSEMDLGTWVSGLLTETVTSWFTNCEKSYILLYSLVAQLVKNPPATQETQVQPLRGEDPLEKEIATHSCILVQKISQTKEPGGLQSMGLQRVGHDLATRQPPPQTLKIQELSLKYVVLAVQYKPE